MVSPIMERHANDSDHHKNYYKYQAPYPQNKKVKAVRHYAIVNEGLPLESVSKRVVGWLDILVKPIHP